MAEQGLELGRQGLVVEDGLEQHADHVDRGLLAFTDVLGAPHQGIDDLALLAQGVAHPQQQFLVDHHLVVARGQQLGGGVGRLLQNLRRVQRGERAPLALGRRDGWISGRVLPQLVVALAAALGGDQLGDRAHGLLRRGRVDAAGRVALEEGGRVRVIVQVGVFGIPGVGPAVPPRRAVASLGADDGVFDRGQDAGVGQLVVDLRHGDIHFAHYIPVEQGEQDQQHLAGHVQRLHGLLEAGGDPLGVQRQGVDLELLAAVDGRQALLEGMEVLLVAQDAVVGDGLQRHRALVGVALQQAEGLFTGSRVCWAGVKGVLLGVIQFFAKVALYRIALHGQQVLGVEEGGLQVDALGLCGEIDQGLPDIVEEQIETIAQPLHGAVVPFGEDLGGRFFHQLSVARSLGSKYSLMSGVLPSADCTTT